MIEENIQELGVEEVMFRMKHEVEKRKQSAMQKLINKQKSRIENILLDIETEEIDIMDDSDTEFEQKDVYEYADFSNYHGEEFVKNCYIGLLGREAHITEINNYLHMLINGVKSKSEIISMLRFSKEGRVKNVRLLGSWKWNMMAMANRIPIMGYLFKWLVSLITLPILIKRLNVYESFTYQLHLKSEVSQFKLQTALNKKSDITHIENIHKSFKNLFDFVDDKAEKTTLESLNRDLRGVLENKANNAELDSLKSDLVAELTNKADQTVLDSLTSDLIEELEHKANNKELASQTQKLEHKLENKADQTALDSLTSDLTGELENKADQAALDSLTSDLTGELENKANKTALDSLTSDLTRELENKANKTALDSLSSDLKEELKNKADQTALNSLTSDLTGELEHKANKTELTSQTQKLEHKIENKADQTALDLQNRDLTGKLEKKANKTEFALQSQKLELKLENKADKTSLDLQNRDLTRELETKVNKTAVDSLHSNLMRKLETKANQTALDTITSEITRELENKANTTTLELYLKTVSYAKEYMKISQQNMQNLIQEAKQRLPKSELNQKELMLITEEEKHGLDTFYVEFEDKFRGSREDIKDRVKVYLPYLEQLPFKKEDIKSLDVGCGRGEWIELLNEQGYKNTKGLDINRVMVSRAQDLDLDVVASDVIEYLKSQEDETLNIITGFHIIEHIPFEVLMKLFEESYRVLKKGGMVIFETPNPENIVVGACNFYIDPTHNNPLPPVTIEFILQSIEFKKVEIKRLNGNYGVTYDDKFLNHQFASQLDYAVMGYKR